MRSRARAVTNCGVEQITRAQGNEEAAKIDAQKEAEARVRKAEIESEAAK